MHYVQVVRDPGLVQRHVQAAAWVDELQTLQVPSASSMENFVPSMWLEKYDSMKAEWTRRTG
jgi:hypothetical protein